MTGKSKVVALEHVVIRFAGDSGDGMQLTGNLFSDSTAFAETISLPSRITQLRSVHHKAR